MRIGYRGEYRRERSVCISQTSIYFSLEENLYTEHKKTMVIS